MLIANWGKKGKKVSDASIEYCNNCNNVALFQLWKVEKTAGIFFVPMAKWDKTYYLICQKCEAAFEINRDLNEDILRTCTELPDVDTSVSIYNDIDDLFVKHLKEESPNDIKKLFKEIPSILHAKGYKEKDINSILTVYLKMIAKSKK